MSRAGATEVATPDFQEPGMLEVNVKSAAELDRALEEAIDQTMKAAVHHGTGIMVTRIGTGRYIVRAHPTVPYGLVRQDHA
ncbi:hypothetical protein [Arthrobacter sp. HMWF013]|uniref:hypothetical protein n=1 Tax=Arthrobacter sp. HMWF013 TaxID=2056849 RepID=UPI000D3B7614|nr:hypothetical protein [Arthrobacter sp. HMWF013]PTT67099.1 hypothetical protein DBR22_09590 [Arthrobacter sp. HMWF013]